MCIVGTIEALLKTSAANKKVKSTSFKELPAVKRLSRIKQENGSVTYRGAEVTKYDQAMVFLKCHRAQYVELVPRLLAVFFSPRNKLLC